MRTRFAIPLFIGLFLTLVLFSAEPPIQRQPWTTNTPGAWNAVGSNITFYRSDAYNRPFRVFSTNSSINTFLVNSNGTVGINTNIPQANFHVVGTTLIDGPFTNTTGNAAFLGGTAYFEDGLVVAQPSIMNGLTATNLEVYTAAYNRDPLKVSAWNNVSGFLVNSNGLVGIGTNDPKFKLDIAGGSVRMDRSDAALETKTTAYRCQYGSGVLLFNFSGFPSATAANRYCAIESSDAGDWRSLVLNPVPTTGGNVGIGITNPLAKLHVRNAGANSDPAIYLANDAQIWGFQNYGTSGDDFRILDVTDSSAVALGIDAGDQVVYIPGGLHSTNGNVVTVLGRLAAVNSAMTNGVAIGHNAGYTALNAYQSVVIGYIAGQQSVNSYECMFNGVGAGYFASNCYSSVFDGFYAGRQSTNSYNMVCLGGYSGYLSTNCWGSYAGGNNTAYRCTNGYDSSFIGAGAASYSSNAYRSVFNGSSAGSSSINANHCIFLGPYSGTNTIRPKTLLIDGDYKGTNALVYGEFDNNLVRINDRLQVYSWTNNAGVDKVNQPIGLFASLKMTTTNTVAVGVAGTYYNITNWTAVVTNGFTASTLGWGGGFVTNQYAGFYKISGSVAALPGNSDTVELEVFFNETQNKELASFGSYDNPARIRTLPLTGTIIYIPANTGISLRISNESDADDIDIWRASLTIGTP